MALDQAVKSLELCRGQQRLVLILTISAAILSTVWLIAAYSDPAPGADLPVILDDTDHEFTGVFVVDPNTTPVDSLELLPGIGPVLAERIVAYRQDHMFEREVDITEVYGIGPKLYEQLRPYLKIKRQD